MLIDHIEDQILYELKRDLGDSILNSSKIEIGYKLKKLEMELKEIRGILEVNSIRDTAHGWKYSEDRPLQENLMDYLIHLDNKIREGE